MGKQLLTPRLQAAARWVLPGARLADVGTDHAYLPIHLLQEGIVDFAIASDLREGPLARAEESGRRYGLSDRLSFRLTDGLTGIGPEEADTIVIAGMGGEVISAILAAAPWTRDGRHRLILQPMSKVEELRQFLSEQGYVIQEEALAREEEKLYLLILAQGGESRPLSPAELYGGVKLERDPLWRDYLDQQIRKLARALAGMEQSRGEAPAGMAQLRATLAALKERYDHVNCD